MQNFENQNDSAAEHSSKNPLHKPLISESAIKTYNDEPPLNDFLLHEMAKAYSAALAKAGIEFPKMRFRGLFSKQNSNSSSHIRTQPQEQNLFNEYGINKGANMNTEQMQNHNPEIGFSETHSGANQKGYRTYVPFGASNACSRSRTAHAPTPRAINSNNTRFGLPRQNNNNLSQTSPIKTTRENQPAFASPVADYDYYAAPAISEEIYYSNEDIIEYLSAINNQLAEILANQKIQLAEILAELKIQTCLLDRQRRIRLS